MTDLPETPEPVEPRDLEEDVEAHAGEPVPDPWDLPEGDQ